MQCAACKKTYQNPDGYVNHLKFFHKTTTDFQCIYCPASSSNIYSFKRHLVKCWTRCLRNIENETSNYNVQPANIVEEDLFDDQNDTYKYDSFVADMTYKAAGHVLGLIAHGDVTLTRAMQFLTKCNLVMEPISKFIDDNTKSNFGGERGDILQAVANPYQKINTPKKFFNYLKKARLYNSPSQYVIQKSLQIIVKNGRHKYEYRNETGTILDIKLMFQQFFEIPGMFDKMYSKMQELMNNSSKITNFVQGKRWKQIVAKCPDKILIPYHLYHDDYDVGNSQGYKRGKQAVAAVNILLPLLDENEISKLKYIFPAAFVKKSFTKNIKKSWAFSHLIDVLKSFSEDGIDISVAGKVIKIFPILGLVIGDNLAQHELLDFTGSFSHRLMCRFCKMTANERKTCSTEKTELMRLKKDYNQDAQDKNSGVSAVSPFNKMPFFHVYENYSVDLMHDVLEGVIVYGLQYATDTLVRQGFVTVRQLKRCVDNFDYGEIDSRNRLSKDNIDDEGKWRLNAHDSIMLLKYFTLLIGDKVPSNNSTLHYVIALEEMVDIIMSDEFDNDKLEQLRNAVEKHGQLYQNFKKIVKNKTTGLEETVSVTQPPKGHLITHYATCILWSGPPIGYWSMRQEGQNRVYKTYANVNACKKNLSFSTGKKSQLMFADLIYKLKEKPEDIFSYNTRNENFNITDKPYHKNLELSPDEEFYQFNSIQYRGTAYKKMYYVFREDILYIISDIIMNKTNGEDKVYLILNRGRYKNSEKCYNCYIVDQPTDIYTKKEIQFCGKPFTPFKFSDGRLGFKYNKYSK